MLNEADQSNATIQQRTAEMKFLRAYGHFQLKRLFKKIPFVNKLNMTEDDYNNMSNTEYTNDEGWQQIINDLEDAYAVLPVTQSEKGRPTKAAAAAFLAKVYLYKAYHQDNANNNQVTSINEADLQKVVDYTNPSIYAAAGYGLESDMHNNFRPEEQYENGKESIWAIQYSKNDGTYQPRQCLSYQCRRTASRGYSSHPGLRGGLCTDCRSTSLRHRRSARYSLHVQHQLHDE